MCHCCLVPLLQEVLATPNVRSHASVFFPTCSICSSGGETIWNRQGMHCIFVCCAAVHHSPFLSVHSGMKFGHLEKIHFGCFFLILAIHIPFGLSKVWCLGWACRRPTQWADSYLLYSHKGSPGHYIDFMLGSWQGLFNDWFKWLDVCAHMYSSAG